MHPLVQEQLEMLLAHSTQALADHELHEAGLEHQLAAERALIDKTRALINATRFELAGGVPVEASSHGTLGLGKLLGSVIGGVNIDPDDGQRDGFDSEGSAPADTCPACDHGLDMHGEAGCHLTLDGTTEFCSCARKRSELKAPVVTGLSFTGPPTPEQVEDNLELQRKLAMTFGHEPDETYFDDEGGCASCHVRPGMLHLNGCAVEARLRGGA